MRCVQASTVAASLLVTAALAVSTANAATPAFDSAADAAYDDGWQAGDNGGTGLGPWTFSLVSMGGGSGGPFVFTSTENGDGLDNGNVGGIPVDGDIDTAGRAWGIFSDQGAPGSFTATRTFTGGPLEVGQHAILHFDNGFIDSGKSVAAAVTAPGAGGFSVSFEGGTANYTIGDALGVRDSGVGYTDEGLTIDWVITGASTYDVTLTRRDGVTATLSGSFTGSTTGFAISNAGAGPGASHNLYANSLTVTPEPSTGLALLAVAGATAPRRRRGR